MNDLSPSPPFSPLTPSNPGPLAAGERSGREGNFLAAARKLEFGHLVHLLARESVAEPHGFRIMTEEKRSQWLRVLHAPRAQQRLKIAGMEGWIIMSREK